MRKILIFLAILILVGIGIYVAKNNLKIKHKINSQKINEKSALNDYQISKGSVPSINFSLPDGFVVHTFASNLGNARDMIFSPGGTLLVSDTAGNRVFALADRDADGVADENKVIIQNAPNVHGLAFFNGKLYIANVTSVERYNWDEENLAATFDKRLFNLPYNTDHDNRIIVFENSGKMFVSLGSTCDVCIQSPTTGGSVLISDANGSSPQVFARGLRNAAFLAINPLSGDLWATEMGRDHLGDNLPPDEINIIKQGSNYGWPNCYGKKVWDRNFDKSKNNPCTNTTSPIYEIPAHSAPLGLTFINSNQFPQDWQNDLLVAYHGSWNKTVPTGFKIVQLNVEENSITDSSDFMTGFQEGPNAKSAYARPVDLIFDKVGNLYVSDDKGGNIFIIQRQVSL